MIGVNRSRADRSPFRQSRSRNSTVLLPVDPVARTTRVGPVLKLGVMVPLALAVVAYLRTFVLARHSLGLEAAALCQQLAVLKRKQPSPRLRSLDRLLWVALRPFWSGWTDALIGVKPETAVSLHPARF